MADIIELFKSECDNKFDITYSFDANGKVIAVGHDNWPFRIQRNGDEIAIVCKDTDEPFGIISRDTFNTIVMCWLLVDDPKLLDDING